jgi:hypothetical protein
LLPNNPCSSPATNRHEHRTPRTLGQRGHGARDREQLRAARRIVFRAVVDLVAGRVRLADAEVIVVRGVDDHFVLELRVAAGSTPATFAVRTRETLLSNGSRS